MLRAISTLDSLVSAIYHFPLRVCCFHPFCFRLILYDYMNVITSLFVPGGYVDPGP